MAKFMMFGIGDDSFQLMASSVETFADHLITKSTYNYEVLENMEKQR